MNFGELNQQMNPSTEQSFRTRTGTCTITPEQIILTGEKTEGGMGPISIGNKTIHPVIIYGVFGAISLAMVGRAIQHGRFFPEVILCVALLLYLRMILTTKQLSTAPVIERSAIRNVESHPPYPPAMRGYFAILFEEGRMLRKRLIMLPESTEGGEEEYERAESILMGNGLLRRTLQS